MCLQLRKHLKRIEKEGMFKDDIKKIRAHLLISEKDTKKETDEALEKRINEIVSKKMSKKVNSTIDKINKIIEKRA